MSSCVTTKLKLDKVPLEKYFSQHPIFAESHSGLMVYDPDEEKVVFDFNSHKHFTPASNTKLLTYYAALTMLPDSIPAMKYCKSGDTLYFTGTGDPTLLYHPFEYEKSIDFLKKNSQIMAYVSRPMEDERFGPGWAWDDYPYYYSAEKSSFPIYGNMAYFQKKTDEDHVNVAPRYFEDNLTLRHNPDLSRVAIERGETSNKFKISYGSTPFELDKEMPFIYSDDLFVTLLSDTLQREVTMIDHFPSCKQETLYSIPTDSIAKYILIDSDNFLAEQMLVSISNQFGDTLSSKKTIDFMIESHLASMKNEIHWMDGSGLSRYNQVTPNAMIYVLKEIRKLVPEEKLYYMLPAAGETGTLSNSFSSLTGKIHAKTGSMSHVYNLSGYLLTNSGKTLIFSFMNNNYRGSSTSLKEAMEEVLSVFYANYK